MMKKIILAILLCAMLAIVMPSCHLAESMLGKLGTLYAVSGIMFSIGMSLIVTSSFSKIKNENIRRKLISAFNMVRNSYIIVFMLVTLAYIFVNPKEKPIDLWIIPNLKWLIRFSMSIFVGLLLIISIVFFIVNFIELQKLNSQTDELINKT